MMQHADYGPVNQQRFTSADVGTKTEVTQREVTIAGLYRMGTGLAANAAIIMSHDGFNRLSAERLLPLNLPISFHDLGDAPARQFHRSGIGTYQRTIGEEDDERASTYL